MLWRAIFLFPSPALQLSYFVALLHFSPLLSIATSPLRRSLLRTRDFQRRRKSRLRESPVASRQPTPIFAATSEQLLERERVLVESDLDNLRTSSLDPTLALRASRRPAPAGVV